MSQDLAVLQSSVPAFLKKKDASTMTEFNQQAAAGTLGVGSVDRISLKTSRFRLIKGGKEIAVLKESHVDVIIVRANTALSKVWYEKAWNGNEGDNESPDCFSDDGIRPSSSSKKPQCATCVACPHNQWGSKINPQTGKDGKACADSKRVSVVAESTPDGDPFQLAIPAASMKDFGAYLSKLNQLSPPVPYNCVVTRVEFDINESFPKLMFSPLRYLTAEEYEVIDGRYDEEAIKLTAGLVREGDTGGKATPEPEPEETDEAAAAGFGSTSKAKPAAKAKAKPAAKPKAAPAEEAVEEEVEEVEEAAAHGFGSSAAKPANKPASKPATKTAAPPAEEADAEDDISDILEGWDLED